MKRIFRPLFFAFIVSLIPLFSGCSNSIDFEVESESCEVAITNLRYDITRMNTKIPLVNGDTMQNWSLIDIYFDYHGDCLDTNAYFTLDFEGFYVPEFGTEYETLGAGQIRYEFYKERIIGDKIHLGMAFIFNSSDYQKITITGHYRGYEPATGYAIKETNSLVSALEKLDDMY